MNLDQLIEKHKINIDISLQLTNSELHSLFSKIFDRLDGNYKIHSVNSIKENSTLLCLVFQFFPEEQDSKRFASKRLVQSFDYMLNSISNYESSTIYQRNIYFFIDIFFHNPVFVDYLSETETLHFLDNISKLAEIRYDSNNGNSEIEIALLYAVTVLSYFPMDKIIMYKETFENHFDVAVTEEAKILFEEE